MNQNFEIRIRIDRSKWNPALHLRSWKYIISSRSLELLYIYLSILLLLQFEVFSHIYYTNRVSGSRNFRNPEKYESYWDFVRSVQIYPTHFELTVSDIYIHLYTSTESIINTLILEFVVKKNNIWKKKNLVVTLRLDFYFPFSLAIISKQFFS